MSTQFEFLCEKCFLFCTVDGVRFDPQPIVGRWSDLVDEPPRHIVCAICRVNPPAPEKPITKSDTKVKAEQEAAKWGIDRSMPPERDLPEPDHVKTPDHGQQVARFNATSASRDEQVLAELLKTFDVEIPSVPGDWIPGIKFFHLFGNKAANSCASRLRQHPFIMDNDLDVDSAIIPNTSGTRAEWWAYRVCRRADSERLRRERDKAAGDQSKSIVGESVLHI